MIDEHIFGESDNLDASEYQVGTLVTVKVLDFMGRLPYIDRQGVEKRGGFFKVKNDKGATKEFRLGITNEKILKNKFALKDYNELVGASLAFTVKKYPLNNGFIIVDVKRGVK
jgi:hypothetical protein